MFRTDRISGLDPLAALRAVPSFGQKNRLEIATTFGTVRVGCAVTLLMEAAC